MNKICEQCYIQENLCEKHARKTFRTYPTDSFEIPIKSYKEYIIENVQRNDMKRKEETIGSPLPRNEMKTYFENIVKNYQQYKRSLLLKYKLW